MKKIGILFGKERSFPNAFIQRVNNKSIDGMIAEPVKIDKVWGLLFGNGESLGDKNALYFAAGPDDEKDGIFGSLPKNRRVESD